MNEVMELQLRLNSMEQVEDFVIANSKREGSFDVHCGQYVVDGKSILGVLSVYSNNILTVKTNNMSEADMEVYKEELKKDGIEIICS